MAQVPTQSGPCGLASETLQRSSSNSTGAEGVYEWNEKGLPEDTGGPQRWGLCGTGVVHQEEIERGVRRSDAQGPTDASSGESGVHK